MVPEPYDLVLFDNDEFGVVIARVGSSVNIARDIDRSGHFRNIEYFVPEADVRLLKKNADASVNRWRAWL